MNILKEMKEQLQAVVKKLIKSYPITLTVLIMTTIFIAIFITFSNNNMIKVQFSLVFWLFGLFFLETYFTKPLIKIILSFVTALISVTFSFLIFAAKMIIPYDIIMPLLVGYILILMILVFHKLIKNNDNKLSEYIVNFIENIFLVAVFSIVLHLGVILLTLTFIELITKIDYAQIFMRESVLLIGLFYVPAIIYSMIKMDKNKARNFVKGLFVYVLLPLVLLAFLIIYLYIFKIMVLQAMPSNIIFRILAILYIFAMPTWIISSYFAQDKWLNKGLTILPYLYIPFIFLEIYSIGVRIIAFGMTPLRYLGVMFIIFQIIELILEKVFKKINLILLFLALIVGISTVYPTNLFNVSAVWQNQTLKNNYPVGSNMEKLTEKQKRKVAGAYSYLKDNDLEKYLKSYSQEDINNLNSLADTYTNYNDEWFSSKSIYYYNYKQDFIDVNGYRSLYYIETIQNYDDLTNIIIKYNQTKNFQVDLIPLIKNLEGKDEETINKYMEKNSKINIDDNRDFIITYLNIQYKDSYNNVSDIQLDGYILDK